MRAGRAAVLDALRRLGGLNAAYRTYELLRAVAPRAAWRNARRAPASPDGMPLPPARLIMQVAGTPDCEPFLAGGRLAAESIADTLAGNGLAMSAMREVLDFGCGCGRVIRQWQSAGPACLSGTDYNRELVAWCSAHLPFARFSVNRLAPPLDYATDRFDFIYALSVFTHMPDPLQRAWMGELRRVLAPGGHLLITTHGRYYLGMLSAGERQAFEAGSLVVRYAEVAGTNLCAAFHPEPYVRGTLAAGFDAVDFIPEGALGNPRQDIYLLRKPA